MFTHWMQDKVKELRAQVAALQPAPIEGYNTIQNDERRTVEILHRNELERMNGERRLQYDKLIHDFLVCHSTVMLNMCGLRIIVGSRSFPSPL